MKTDEKFVFVQNHEISQATQEWEGGRDNTAWASYMARVIDRQIGDTTTEGRDQALQNFKWLTGENIPDGLWVQYDKDSRCGMVGFEKKHYFSHGKLWLARVLNLFHRRGWHFHTFPKAEEWYFHFPKREKIIYDVENTKAEKEPPKIEVIEKPMETAGEKKPHEAKVVRNIKRKQKEQINLEELEEYNED